MLPLSVPQYEISILQDTIRSVLFFVAASDVGRRGRGLSHYTMSFLIFSSASKGRASIESYASALLLIWWPISDLFIFIHFWHFTGLDTQSHTVIHLGLGFTTLGLKHIN